MNDPIEADTIGQFVRRAAETWGDAEAVVGSGTRLTFRELDQQSRRLAGRLLRRGVTKHAQIGVSFGNNPDFIVSLLAVSRIGAVAVPVSTFAPGRELLRLVRYGDLAGILTRRQVVGVDQVTRLEQAIPELAQALPELAQALPELAQGKGAALALTAAPNLRWIELLDGDAEAPTWAVTPADDAEDGPIDEAWLDAVEADVAPTDVALMIHTSGTTADPKGVPHVHDTVCFRARYLAERMQYRPGERTYTSQVLFWIGGLTMSFVTTIAAGGTSVWCEKFDAGEVLEIIQSERIDRLAIYAHQAEQLLAHPDFEKTDRSSLRIADPRLSPDRSSTGILTPEGHRMALGMSETFGPYSWGSGGGNIIAPIQDIQPGLQIRVVDERNQAVGDGQTGELVLRGRCVTPGYYKRQKSFGFDADGWFHTGDRAEVDGPSIHFLGRMTEMIKTAGANVAPAEVIEAMLALDGVQEAYVLPLEDPVRGETVAAAVVLRAGEAMTPETLRSALRKDLSSFKVPSTVAFFRSEEIPWTPTFKVRRGQLTQMILDRAGLPAGR